MTLQEYYVNKKKQFQDDMVSLQEKAMARACDKVFRGCNYTSVFKIRKEDDQRMSDLLANDFFYEGMVMKKSYMQCSMLDMTFFYDLNGKARYTYAGCSNDKDSLSKIVNAFQKAEELRIAMDAAMVQLLNELEQKRIQERTEKSEQRDEPDKSETDKVIGKNAYKARVIEKINDLCFQIGGVRECAYIRSLTGKSGYRFYVRTIDLSAFLAEDIEDIVKKTFPGGVAEVKKTLRSQANYMIAKLIFKSLPSYMMEYESEIYGTEEEAVEWLKVYAYTKWTEK